MLIIVSYAWYKHITNTLSVSNQETNSSQFFTDIDWSDWIKKKTQSYKFITGSIAVKDDSLMKNIVLYSI